MGIPLHPERGDRGFPQRRTVTRLMAPVLLWLSTSQPDDINNPDLREKLFTFEV